VNLLTTSSFSTRRLKYVVTLRRSRAQGDENRKPYIGLEHIESWTGRLVSDLSSADEAAVLATRESDSLSSTFEPGDVLFGKLRPYLAKAWVAEFAGRCTTEALVMQPVAVEARFLHYVCLCPNFIELVDASTFGSKMPRAEWEFIGNIKIPVPPLPQQRAIADYLDRETARIDALIAAKERLLALLAEKRRALITRAVTRGLDPNAPMKDSGIPWLGEIPAHWTATRIKHVVTLRRSRVQSDEERKPYIGLEHVESWTGRLVSDLSSADEAAVSATRESDSLSSTFEPGDVLFGKLRPYLAKAWVAEFAGRCTTEALVMQPVAVEARFLRYVFLCPDFIDLVDASTFGSKMPRADWDFIGNIKIPLPPATEQRAIVEHITEETARLDALRAATERSIALLKERRAALISAAVTGQIDVPACAASTADREAVP